MPAFELSVAVERCIAAHGAQEQVLAVKRIVISQVINFCNITACHVTHRQCIGVFINGNGFIHVVFIGVIIRPLCLISRVQALLISGVTAVQHILDAQQRVRDRCIAVITGVIAVHAVTHGFNKVNDSGVHDRAGMGDTLQAKCAVVIDAAEEGLFRTVESRILFLHQLCCSAAVPDVVLIGLSGGICNFLVDILHRINGIIGCLTAYGKEHENGEEDADTLLALRGRAAHHKVEQNQVNAHQCCGNPDSALCHLVELHSGNNGNYHHHDTGGTDQVLALDSLAIGKRRCTHCQEDEGQQE